MSYGVVTLTETGIGTLTETRIGTKTLRANVILLRFWCGVNVSIWYHVFPEPDPPNVNVRTIRHCVTCIKTVKCCIGETILTTF